MSKVMAIGAAGTGHNAGMWGAIHRATSRASLAVAYAMMGLAGVLLWVMVHLPVGARARESMAYAMAGCVGMVTLGWQMLRAQRTGSVRG